MVGALSPSVGSGPCPPKTSSPRPSPPGPRATGPSPTSSPTRDPTDLALVVGRARRRRALGRPHARVARERRLRPGRAPRDPRAVDALPGPPPSCVCRAASSPSASSCSSGSGRGSPADLRPAGAAAGRAARGRARRSSSCAPVVRRAGPRRPRRGSGPRGLGAGALDRRRLAAGRRGRRRGRASSAPRPTSSSGPCAARSRPSSRATSPTPPRTSRTPHGWPARPAPSATRAGLDVTRLGRGRPCAGAGSAGCSPSVAGSATPPAPGPARLRARGRRRHHPARRPRRQGHHLRLGRSPGQASRRACSR